MSHHRKVAIFWDYENCSPPLYSQGHAIVNGIRRIAHVFGYVTSFKAYLDISSQSSKSVGFRSDLQSSGVSMTDCPHSGRKDVVDKMILVDMLAFANDHPSPATIILIAGDRDYAYAVSTLRLRQYKVVLIVPPAPNIPQSLESQASVVVDWNFAILGKRTEADTSPVRQPYRNLDDDIVERLSREVRDLNEDPVITLISSSLLTPPAHVQRDIVAEQQQPPVIERNTDSGHAAHPASCTPKKAASTIPATPVLPRFGSAASQARFATKSTQTVPDTDRDLGYSLTANDELSDESLTDDFVSIADEIQDASHDSFATAPSSSSRLERNQNIAVPDLTPTTGLRNVPLSPFPVIPYNLDPQSAPLGSPSQTRIISGGTPISYGNTPQNSAPAAVPLSQPIDIDPTSAMLDNHIVMSDKAAVKDALGYSNRDGDHNSSTDKLTNVSISSPLSTKVDDPSHAQVANSAESYHTTGDAYIVNSALVNDSPPTPEHSVIPISSTSSSAPSPSTPSTPLTPSSLTPSSLTPSSSSIASNSEIGSQQATSVITDNKDKSSGCQAPLIDSESVEDKIRRLTPQKFLPLINQLLLARLKGILNLPRSDIANDLVRVDKDVYKRVGATKFADYALLAKEASIIEFGGGTTRSNSWITLHPRFRQELDAPKSSTPSTNHNDNPPTPQNNISGAKTSSAAPTPPSCTASQGTTKLAPLNPSPPPVVPIPPCFQPLVTSLSKIHKSGLAKPFPSTVGLIIGPEIYSKSGASSLTEYFGQAVDAGVVQCGGNSGHAWVSLHPDVLSGKRSC